jgi:hypothetical protein
MLSKSERYRNAAEACRKTAETSATPLEWLRFAAERDSMATQDEELSARETKFMIECLIADTTEALALHTADLLVIARDLRNAGAALVDFGVGCSVFAELVLAMLGVAAKLERRIKDRTAVGCGKAMARGVKFVRKPSRRGSLIIRRAELGGAARFRVFALQ